MMTPESLIARTVRDGDCMRWQGAHTPQGYGHISIKGKAKSVHRVMFEAVHGECPAGLDIDHTCFVRDCINPDHLEAVTHRENLMRSAQAGRNALSHINSDTCPQGHKKTPENSTVFNGRVNGCRECHRIRNRAWGKKRKDCPKCGAHIQAKSLSRHIRNVHGGTDDD